MTAPQRYVSLKDLKDLAARGLQDYPIVRSLLLQEADQLEASEFVVKCGVWLRLLTEERRASRTVAALQNRAAVSE